MVLKFRDTSIKMFFFTFAVNSNHDELCSTAVTIRENKCQGVVSKSS